MNTKQKIFYDVTTGEIKNDRKYLALTEDFWIGRREGSQGTEIKTLPGGENVGETGESEYFKNKLYTALNVPKSRFSDQGNLFGNTSEITRDELRFSRFIDSLRTRFNLLFENLLGRELILTGVMTEEEWNEIKGNIIYVYAQDSYHVEQLDSQNLIRKVDIINRMAPFVGRYFSDDYIFKQVLRLSDEEIEQEKKQIQKSKPIFEPDNEPNN